MSEIRTTVAQYQARWFVPLAVDIPAALSSVARDIRELDEKQPPQLVKLSYHGSPHGTRLNGSPEQVYEEFLQLVDDEFITATLTFFYANPNGRKLQISVNFPLRQVNLNADQVPPEIASASLQLVRRALPRGDLPLLPGVEELQRTLNEAHKVKRTLAIIERDARTVGASVSGIAESAEQTGSRIQVSADKAANIIEALDKAKELSNDAVANIHEHRAALASARDEAIALKEAVQQKREEVGPLVEGVKKFHGDIEHLRGDLGQLKKNANNSIAAAQDASSAIIEKHKTLQQAIEEQLLRGQPAGLFLERSRNDGKKSPGPNFSGQARPSSRFYCSRQQSSG